MRTHMRSLLVSITISYEISYVYRSATAKLCPCHAKLERQHRSCHDKTQSFCGTSKYRAKHCPNRYQLCHSEALPSYGCVMSDGHVKLDIDCLPPYVESSKHQQEKKFFYLPNRDQNYSQVSTVGLYKVTVRFYDMQMQDTAFRPISNETEKTQNTRK